MVPLEVQNLIPDWLDQSDTVNVAVLDGNGTCLLMNETFKKLLKAAALGQVNIIDWVHPDDTNILQFALETLVNRPEQKRQLQLRMRSNGSFVPIHWEMSTLCVGESTDRLIVVLGTKINNDAAALPIDDDQRFFFRSLIDRVPNIAIQIYRPDGTIKYWNKASEELFGYESSSVIGKNIFDLLITEHDRDEVAAYIQHCADNNLPIQPEEFRITRQDGRDVYVYSSQTVAVNNNGEPEIYCMDVDLTELEATRQKFEQLVEWFDHSNDSIQVTDEDGTIIFANAESQQRLGLRLDELIGHPIGSIEKVFENIEDWKAHVRHLKHVGSMIIEGMQRRKDGTEFPVEASVTYQETNGRGYVVAFIRDISERKVTEKELRSTLDLVSEQNKRLLNFNYIVSHNIRSHASNISGLVDLLITGRNKVERKNIEGLLGLASLNLMTTIEDLNKVITIQRNINEQRLAINLLESVNSTLDVLKGEIHHNNMLVEIDVNPKFEIYFNQSYLDSILLNLVSNAVKYHNPEKRAEILLKAYEMDDYIVFEVIDNGLGIDLNKHGEKLFSMYKTFHGNPDARGLGLFITKSQVDALGGKIEVDSQPGQGSTFRVFFPCNH
jgi:PAS domain S-box-containing protein